MELELQSQSNHGVHERIFVQDKDIFLALYKLLKTFVKKPETPITQFVFASTVHALIQTKKYYKVLC